MELIAVMIRKDFRRNFAARHPLFRLKESDTGVRWARSAYYLWWRFLRLHEGYRRTCEKGGKGLYAKLYNDFGDVHATEFKEWWTTNGRGMRLFSEPPSPTGIVALSDRDLADLVVEGRDERTLIVAIPLDYQRRMITKAFNKLLTQHFTRKLGDKRVHESRARYPLAMVPDVAALQVTLECYELRKEHPEKPLWWIAQQVGVSARLTAAELAGTGGNTVSKKASMTAGVSRKLRHAATIIEGVGRGIFPAR